MANVQPRRKFIDLQKREMRFRNEMKESLVKCLFCQEMLPKSYEAIQAHVDAVHKEKRAASDGNAAGGKPKESDAAGTATDGEKTLKKRKRKRVRDSSTAASSENDALRTAQPPDRHFCQICSRGFNFPHRLVGHMELVHKRFDAGDATHGCAVCQREFKFARLVENHLHSHHSGVLYRCLACSETFSVAQHLDAHMAKKHEGLSYSCKICSKLFFNTYDLQTHVDVSHQFEANDAFLVCRKCGRNFAFISALEKHEETHNATAKNDQMQMTICLPALPKGFLLSMNEKERASPVPAAKPTPSSIGSSSSSSSLKSSSSSQKSVSTPSHTHSPLTLTPQISTSTSNPPSSTAHSGISATPSSLPLVPAPMQQQCLSSLMPISPGLAAASPLLSAQESKPIGSVVSSPLSAIAGTPPAIN